jgi:hypothetical protein
VEEEQRIEREKEARQVREREQGVRVCVCSYTRGVCVCVIHI